MFLTASCRLGPSASSSEKEECSSSVCGSCRRSQPVRYVMSFVDTGGRRFERCTIGDCTGRKLAFGCKVTSMPASYERKPPGHTHVRRCMIALTLGLHLPAFIDAAHSISSWCRPTMLVCKLPQFRARKMKTWFPVCFLPVHFRFHVFPKNGL